MTFRNWKKYNKRKCCANVLVEDEVITLRNNFPSSWLDMEVEDIVDEGDFVDLWLR